MLHYHLRDAPLTPPPRTAPFLCRCVGVWQNDRVEIIANEQGA